MLLKSILLICGLTASSWALNTDSLAHALTDSISRRKATHQWELFPLTRFPAVKTQHHPFSMECNEKYVQIPGKGAVVCSSEGATFTVGTHYADDSTNIYRAEKFKWENGKWIVLQDYFVYTDKWDKITYVHIVTPEFYK